MATISISGAGTAAANQLYTLGLAGRYTAPNGYYLDPLGFSGYGIYDNTDVLLYSSGVGVLGPYSEVTGAAPAPTATLQAETTTVVTAAQALLSEGNCFACFGMSIADILGLALLSQIADGGGGSGAANMSGNGDPTGVVTPNAVGVLYFDNANPPTTYRATGTTSADWAQII